MTQDDNIKIINKFLNSSVKLTVQYRQLSLIGWLINLSSRSSSSSSSLLRLNVTPFFTGDLPSPAGGSRRSVDLRAPGPAGGVPPDTRTWSASERLQL